MRRVLIFALFLLVGMLVVSSTALAQQPTFSELGEGWTQIPVGGNARCIRNTPYSFFVHPGTSDNLMIYFQGGGACWDGLTCVPGGGVSPHAEDVGMDGEVSADAEGLFDLDNPDNPVSDYNIVFVPYCSGDIHTGNNVITYTIPKIESIPETMTIPNSKRQYQGIHRGFVNASGVMDWVFANIENPESVFVSGCSAGGYGARFFAPYVMQHYEGVPAVMLADAANGVATPDFVGIENWRTARNVPDFLADQIDMSPDTFAPSSTIAMAQYFPDNTFAEYNTFLDQVQVGFYGIMLGTQVNEDNFAEVAEQWATGLVTNLTTIQATVPNFRSYTAGGMEHCITVQDRFYEYEVGGVTFRDWVANLVSGEPVDTVSCDIAGGECLKAPGEE